MIEKLFGDMLESENDCCVLGRDIITGTGHMTRGFSETQLCLPNVDNENIIMCKRRPCCILAALRELIVAAGTSESYGAAVYTLKL